MKVELRNAGATPRHRSAAQAEVATPAPAQRIAVDAAAQRSARARFAQRLPQLEALDAACRAEAPANDAPAQAMAVARRAAPVEVSHADGARAHADAVAAAANAAAISAAVGADDVSGANGALLGICAAWSPQQPSAAHGVDGEAPVMALDGARVEVAAALRPADTRAPEPVEGASVAAACAAGIRAATDGGAPFDVWTTLHAFNRTAAATAQWWEDYATGSACSAPLPVVDCTGAPPPAEAAAPARTRARPRTSAPSDGGPRVVGFTVRPRDSKNVDAPPETDPALAAPPSSAATGQAALAARQDTIHTLYGEPEAISAVDCVTQDTKLATLRQVLGAEQAALFETVRQQPGFDVDAAFMAVLAASRTAGVHQVAVGNLVAHFTVDADTGAVNGAPLASDAELALAPRYANLTMAQRQDELRALGVSELWLATADAHQVLRVFNEIALRRARGVTGDITIELDNVVSQHGSTSARIESSGLVVPQSEKIQTILAVLSGADRTTFVQLLESGHLGLVSEGVDAAFDAILAARRTPGSHTLGFDIAANYRDMNDFTFVGGATHFSATIDVDSAGRVNGAALRVDEAARAAGQLSDMTPEAKERALRLAGFPDGWVLAADAATKDYALACAWALGRHPGTHTLDLPLTYTYGENELTAHIDGAVTLSVTEASASSAHRVALTLGADGSVMLPDGRSVASRTDAILRDLSARETREWPAGSPTGRVVNRIEDTGWPVSDGEKLAALAGVLEGPARDALLTLASGPGGVDPTALDDAYQALLAARRVPGAAVLSFTIVPRDVGFEGQLLAGSPQAFSVSATVDADGRVNGRPLTVDSAARYGSELATVPQSVKDLALQETGFSSGWVQTAPAGLKDFVLGRLRALSLEPGTHTIDCPVVAVIQGESDQTYTYPGRVTVGVSSDGKVNGRVQSIETALALHLTVERMPMAEKRTLLLSLGVPLDAARAMSPTAAAALLTEVGFAQRTPGEHTAYFEVAGAPWQMTVRVDETGKITAAGAAAVPDNDDGWRGFASIVLTVVSIAFPVAAPVCAVIQAGLAYDSGVRGIGLVAAVAGAAAGVSGMSDAAAGATTASTTTTTMSNIATVLQATNAAHNAVEGESVLGLFSSFVSLAAAAGNLAGQQLGADFDVLLHAGRGAGYAERIARGDLQGLFAAAMGDALRAQQSPGADARTQDGVASPPRVASPPYGDSEGDPPVNADGSAFTADVRPATTQPTDPPSAGAAEDPMRDGAAASVGEGEVAAIRVANRPPVDEAAERALIGRNEPARLIDFGGDAAAGTTLLIHGINGSPETLAPLADTALGQGGRTVAVAYDDNYRRLTDSTSDVVALLRATIAALPEGTTLTIEAHCMGSRVMLAALGRLAQEGALDDVKIRFDMVAPPLNGFAAANAALLSYTTPGIGALVANVRPGIDMGSWSAFQSELDQVVLPPNVDVRVVIGSNDGLIEMDADWYRAVARLGAQLEIRPGADHTTIIDSLAADRASSPGAAVPVAPPAPPPRDPWAGVAEYAVDASTPPTTARPPPAASAPETTGASLLDAPSADLDTEEGAPLDATEDLPTGSETAEPEEAAPSRASATSQQLSR